MFPLTKISLLFFCFLTLFLIACKKEVDSQVPQIMIQLPGEGSFFKVGDSIDVMAQINDNENIESVEVRLNRLSDNAKVNTSVFRTIGSTSYNLSLSYVISDTLLKTDDYYLSILAYDGENLGRAFQKIHISALAKKRLSVLALTSDANTTTLYELNNNSTDFLHTFDSDYGGAGISAVDQLLYLSGKKDNRLFAYDLKNNLNLWTQTYLSQPDERVFYHLSMDEEQRNAAISLRQGFVEVLNAKGNKIKKFELQQAQIPQRQFLEKELTFVESRSLNTNAHYLEIFKSFSNSAYDRQSILFQPIQLFEQEGDMALIFGNVSGSSKLYEYNYSSRSIRTVDVIVNDSIVEVIKINSNTFLISTNNGIYTYLLNSGSSIEYLSGIKASTMVYDPLNNELILANNKTYYVYSYSKAALIQTGSLPTTIHKLLIRYNI